MSLEKEKSIKTQTHAISHTCNDTKIGTKPIFSHWLVSLLLHSFIAHNVQFIHTDVSEYGDENGVCEYEATGKINQNGFIIVGIGIKINPLSISCSLFFFVEKNILCSVSWIQLKAIMRVWLARIWCNFFFSGRMKCRTFTYLCWKA